MTEKAARELAQQYIDSHKDPGCGDIEILSAETIEKEYGWIFFHQSRQFLETRDIRYLLAGNGPILVERSGRIVPLPSAIPVEESLRRYESGQPLLPRPQAPKN